MGFNMGGNFGFKGLAKYLAGVMLDQYLRRRVVGK